MNRWLCLLFLLVATGALALRYPNADIRPMHNDEGVNAIKLRGLMENGNFQYDPNEYHGPLLYYASVPVQWMLGATSFGQVTEQTLRAVTIFAGVLMILLLWLMKDALGRAGTFFAALLMAVSPAMVFYSRYFIHEMLLMLFLMLFIASAWRYWRSCKLGWALCAGAAIGLMHCTKETFVIPLAAMAGALVCTVVWRSQVDFPGEARQWTNTMKMRFQWKHAVAAVLAAIVTSLLFFTSFFTNAGGLMDSIRSYAPWLHRAGGASPHINPWYFYLERLFWFHHGRGPVWTEVLILLLALVAFISALRTRGTSSGCTQMVRFLGFYTLLQTAAYSIISYKTPWCLLGFWQSMIILAGVGCAELLKWKGNRLVQATLSGLLVIGTAHLAWQAWQLSYNIPAERKNPYVYSQTSADILEMVEKIQLLSRQHPDGNNMIIKVMIPDQDYWPLPWYLRQFNNVGWWSEIPEDPKAPIVVAGANFNLEDRIDTTHQAVGIFCLRYRIFINLYVENDLWKRYMDAKSKTANPAPQP